MPEAKIKIRAFPYYVDAEDPVTGREVRQERIATRGQTVELSDADYERAQRFDAITDPDNSVDTAGNVVDESGEVVKFDPSSDVAAESSVQSLSLWIKEDKPTVDQVVEEANEDPDAARKLLDAENHATGGSPRSTLVEQLNEIIEG
jgi:hypothetical protein